MSINFEYLQQVATRSKKMRLAVAAAHDEEVLLAVVNATNLGLIDAILIGDTDKIAQIANEHNIVIPSDIDQMCECDVNAAALKAVTLVSNGGADFVMKGLMDTSVILKAVLNKEVGLRTGNLLSHLMAYEIANYHKLLFITDGGMNIEPSLEEKAVIIKNSVAALRSLGYEKIKVAVLAAKEKVDPKMKATVDADELKKMCQQGEFGDDVIVDGPLAFDLAISKEAAVIKGYSSEVAGDADILLVPTIEVGNCIGKCLTYFSNVKQGGIILGAKAPIVLVSRSDTHEAKLNSIILGSVNSISTRG